MLIFSGRQRTSVSVAVLLALFLAGCGGGGSGTTPAAGPGSVIDPPPIGEPPPPVGEPPPPVIIGATVTGKINDSGVLASSCYGVGSDTLMACTSAGAIALNPAQDGAIGRDADTATNSADDGKLGFSYTKIGTAGEELAASATSWSCLKDNVTGLIWEIKTADGGLRDFNNRYTNLDGRTSMQYEKTPKIPADGGTAEIPATYREPTEAEIAAPTNSAGFVYAVNAQTLCGAANWRMPSASELHGIVDYSATGVIGTSSLDAAWFGISGTKVGVWSGTQYAQVSGNARTVGFVSGNTGSATRKDTTGHIRLVRSN